MTAGGAFKAGEDEDTLLDGVAAVLRSIAPDDPESVSQRTFNARRPAETPNAQTCCRRADVGWPALKRAAIVTGRERSGRLSGVRRHRPQDPPTVEAAATALRVVAVRRGQRSLRPSEYEETWREIEAERSRAHRHGRGTPLPRVDQLPLAAEWDVLLATAGLEPRGTSEVRPTASERELIIAFIDAFDAKPTVTQLQDWTKFHDVRHRRRARPFSQELDAILVERRARGLPDPPRAPAALDLSTAAPPADMPRGRDTKRWTWEEILAGVRIALDRLESGERLTQRRLLALSKTYTGIPSPAAVERAARPRGMTLDDVRREAAALTL